MNQDFINWLNMKRIPIFIEAEAKESKIKGFINEYNSHYTPSIGLSSNGICLLGDVDKWGIELRIYLNDISGMPDYWLSRKYKNKLYHKDEFSYRLDDNTLVFDLFNHGFRIGYN